MTFPSVGTNSDDEEDGCACKTCRFFWGLDVPSTEVVPLDQLRILARSYSMSIFKAWVRLNSILKRYEIIIGKRWAKKTNVQRTAILLEAWPGMPPTHRPDFAGLRSGCKRHRKPSSKVRARAAHLWPFINLEDLVQPDTLLIYANARGRNLPCRFAFADRSSVHSERPAENNEIEQYRMLLHDRKSPNAYGALTQHSIRIQEAVGLDLPTSELGFHPFVGLQVLEVQARILAFLVDCCQLVLRDHSLENIHMLGTRPAPSLRSCDSGSATITALAREAPYRLPQKLDISRLLTIVTARRDIAEDHIWALREDPGYFAHELKSWGDHCASLILDKFKQPHKCVGKQGFWARAAAEMLSHAYGALVIWGPVHNDLKYLLASEKRHGRSLHPNQRLHPKFEKAFQVFDNMITAMEDWPLNDLAWGFCASPPLRNGYIRPNVCAPSLHQLSVKISSKRMGERRLHDLFRSLLDPRQHHIHGLSNIVEEIQHTIDFEADRNLISSWVAARFADVAMIVEINRQVEIFQPWAMAWRQGLDLSRTSTIDGGHMMEECHAVRDLIGRGLTKSTRLDPANFAYPCDKRRTEATVNVMRDSERRLDNFWEELDGYSLHMTGLTLHQGTERHLLESDRPLHRTAPWVETEKLPNYELPRDLNPVGVLWDIDPNIRTAHEFRSSTIHVTTGKTKIKTRGTNEQAKPGTSPEATPQAHKAKDEITFTVSNRAYRVFVTLFHVTGDHQAAGELAWTDFLYAMSSLGFTTGKLYGSSWQFTPPEAQPNKQPMQFHEPHPHSRLRFWEAKRIGRRLSKTYGWHGGTFVRK